LSRSGPQSSSPCRQLQTADTAPILQAAGARCPHSPWRRGDCCRLARSRAAPNRRTPRTSDLVRRLRVHQCCLVPVAYCLRQIQGARLPRRTRRQRPERLAHLAGCFGECPQRANGQVVPEPNRYTQLGEASERTPIDTGDDSVVKKVNAAVNSAERSVIEFCNPEIEGLRKLIAVARSRLAELEAHYTKDRRAVDLVQATVFGRRPHDAAPGLRSFTAHPKTH